MTATSPPTTSAGVIARLALAADTARLVGADPIARVGADDEGVHQCRVATRRLRSHLETFAPILRSGRTEAVWRDLRWLGRSLGTARDLDVLAARLASDASDGPVPVGVLDRLAAERAEALARLQRMLRTARYRRLLGALGALVAAPPFRASAGLPAEAFLDDAVRSRCEALRAAVLALPIAPSDAELHQIRIVAKPARYVAELAAPVLQSPCDRLAKRLVDLCDHLGDLHDGVRAIEWLDALGDATAQVAVVRAAETARVDEARRTWTKRWDRVALSMAEMPWGLLGTGS